MKNDTPQCVQRIETSADIRRRVETLHASMAESSHGCFSKTELDHLRTVIRLTVEFHSYLRLACTHHFCLTYMSESIFSGVDSYCGLTGAYKVLRDATESRIEWSGISAPSLKERFSSIFDEFDRETNFEAKCRLLLDLFKLQIVFAGMSYD